MRCSCLGCFPGFVSAGNAEFSGEGTQSGSGILRRLVRAPVFLFRTICWSQNQIQNWSLNPKKKPKNLLETCPFLALLEPLLSLFGPVSLLLRDQLWNWTFLFKAALAACFFPGLAGSAVPPANPELLADGSAVETEALPPRPRPLPTTTNCQSCQRSGVCSH